MAYRSAISRERRRRRWRLLWRAALLLGVIALFGLIGHYAYQTGTALARIEVTDLQQQIDRQAKQLQAQVAETDRLQHALAAAQESAAALQRRYDADVPSGALAALVQAVKQKLASGLAADQIVKTLGALEPPRPCTEHATRKRFEIQAAGRGEPEGVTFLDGLIQVFATVRGDPDDPTKPATVTVARAWAAQPLKLTGLPIHQEIAINGMSVTLTVEPSDLHGYLFASLSTCGKG
jgi:hypothetical protein